MPKRHFGDFQTPDRLADEVLDVLGRKGFRPAAILEPTCGEGALLAAAKRRFPGARLVGYERSLDYVERARARLGSSAVIEVADFFQVPWDEVLKALPEPFLLLGNPPWVTNSALGATGGTNLPVKTNFKRQVGLEAKTGRSNFDISEWMILHLLSLARGRSFELAMLCKAQVARRVLEQTAIDAFPLEAELRTIDARVHFGAEAHAVLLQARSPSAGAPLAQTWDHYPSLTSTDPISMMGVREGRLCRDVGAWDRTRGLEGKSEIEWRSGVKHDCASVMELRLQANGILGNGGETLDLEREFVFPLLKGADIGHGRAVPSHALIVPQRSLGEDTGRLRELAPRLWAYLEAHREALDARKSSVYERRPPFSVFGVGEYSFAPFKVAVSGLYKKLRFVVVRPFEGRPVVVDDTVYFLPCSTEDQAMRLAEALSSPRAAEFFAARVFWDAKRPISKALLQSLSIEALTRDSATFGAPGSHSAR